MADRVAGSQDIAGCRRIALIDVDARREHALLVIAVCDRGPGVPEAEVDRIFEPFYRPATTEPRATGAGLGLSIARQLADVQHGSLEYQARPDGGSCFVLRLPAADGSVENPSVFVKS